MILNIDREEDRMIAITPNAVLKDKDLVQFQCDNCICLVYKENDEATVKITDISGDMLITKYPLDMEMFRVNSMNDINYHEDRYIGW